MDPEAVKQQCLQLHNCVHPIVCHPVKVSFQMLLDNLDVFVLCIKIELDCHDSVIC